MATIIIGIQMTLEEIEKLINSNDGCECLRGLEACEGRTDVPLEWLERRVNDWRWRVRHNAFCACIGRTDVPLEWLERGINDGDCDVRCSAFQACEGRTDVPLEWLEKGINDEHSGVRTTVSKILFDMGYQFPLVRMVEPADKVYKRCKKDVIVVAEIPKTAQVRGCIGEKCRASEAVILEVITGWNGCVKAVSIWDNEITYKVGDHIVINDFDHSTDEECSTGFHFFNTIEEAKKY